MKYLFFVCGFLLFLEGMRVAYLGAVEDWDAGYAAGPYAIGIALMGVSVGIHIYDNWESKQ